MAPKSSVVEWKYVHHIPDSTNKYKCNFCDHEMTGSLTRIRDHLLGLSKDVTACKSIDSATKASLSRAHKSKLENSNKKSKIIKEIGQFSGFTGASTESKSSHSYQTQTTLNEAWKTIAKEEVDTCVARYFYANGVPFHHLRSPYFLSMVDAISNFGKGYKPPSYESVRTKFIEKEMASISAQLQPIRDSWQDTGCTILCDGWSDKRKRTLINVLTQSPQGVMFMKSVDASDDKKSSEYIADIISETISEVGIENVVHVVTDSASNCKGAGKILMERFPTVFWSPCVAHVLDLLLEDISELPWVKKVVNDAKLIAKFITNHQLTLSRFRAAASRELLTPADTRFATNFITLQRIVEERDALRGVVVGKDWSSSSLSKTDTAVHIENILLGSYFWEESRKVMNIFEPIVILLRMADSEALVMGQIYEGMDQAKEKIKEAFDGIESDYIPIWEMVDSRWNMMHTPLHAAACYLDPRSFGTSQMQDTEVMEGLFDCMERMYSDFTIQGKIRKQIDEYISEQGLSGRRAAKEDRKKMSPLSWWKIYGCSLPDLQKFAIRILGQPCSASACERNWSTFDFIHSKKRNRTVRNPHSTQCYTGGSSSGPAAIVASGLCSAALGTDGGGSIRIPSALCGVVGLKTTYGRTDIEGALCEDGTVEVVAPIAATVEDALLVYAAMLGSSTTNKTISKPLRPCFPMVNLPDNLNVLGSLKLGKYSNWFHDVYTNEIVDACEKVLGLLANTFGVETREIVLPELEEMRMAHLVSIGAEALCSLYPDYKEGRRTEMSYDVRLNMALFKSFSGADYVASQRLRRRIMHYYMESFKLVDVIVTPTTGTTAPIIPPSSLKIGETDFQTSGYIMRFVVAANLLGLPAISIPVGHDKDGLPIGLQLIGRPWAEATLLRLASAIEELCAPSRKRPIVFYDVLKGT